MSIPETEVPRITSDPFPFVSVNLTTGTPPTLMVPLSTYNEPEPKFLPVSLSPYKSNKQENYHHRRVDLVDDTPTVVIVPSVPVPTYETLDPTLVH